LFRDDESVIDPNLEITNRAFNLGVSQEQLHGAQVAGAAVNEGCLGWA